MDTLTSDGRKFMLSYMKETLGYDKARRMEVYRKAINDGTVLELYNTFKKEYDDLHKPKAILEVDGNLPVMFRIAGDGLENRLFSALGGLKEPRFQPDDPELKRIAESFDRIMGG